ncbi:hypothetical protein IAU60_005440 [Kwoniella sp. DSM 27419]
MSYKPQHTTFTHPEHLTKLPEVSLEFLLHLECDMESFTPIGQGPYGNRMNVIFSESCKLEGPDAAEGGKFEGPKLRGTILPGGGDWEIVQPNSVAFLDTRYNLRTHDGATIYLQTRGVRKGPKDVLDNLGKDTSITADQYS